MAWQSPGATSERWIAFADAIIDGQRPMDAVVTAGYPSRGAHNLGSALLAKPEIQALIDTRRSMLVSRTEWTPQRVIEQLADLAQTACNEGQLAVARQCIRDIGEHIGMWPKTPVNVDARSQVLALPENMSIDDLRALASPIYREGADALPEDASTHATDVTGNTNSTG